MQVIHLGIDDTDSVRGHCTTYLAALIVEELLKQGARFVDYPNLIRLNPNIPWKTRGNAAVALRFQTENAQRAFETAKRLLIENSDAKEGLSDPGIVMHVGDVPSDVAEFSKRALYTVLSRHEAEKIIGKN
ncbi:MAG: DNA-binding protein, partial [Thaumarchaeota archaeon]|nr:DNA-binding protein [Nitrososphaerota archaeon]